jgi:hypothetical protein
MTHDHWAVYQFMVNKFGGRSFETYEAFAEAVLLGEATKRFVPNKTWGMYNIDTKKILAEGYLCRYGFDLIKVKQGVVTEYYRRLVSGKNPAFVAYDLETLAPIERYRNIDNQLRKYDWQSDEQLQANNNCTFATLPEDFKTMIQDFEFKHMVFIFAVKPYGRVVEFHYPQ